MKNKISANDLFKKVVSFGLIFSGSSLIFTPNYHFLRQCCLSGLPCFLVVPWVKYSGGYLCLPSVCIARELRDRDREGNTRSVEKWNIVMRLCAKLLWRMRTYPSDKNAEDIKYWKICMTVVNIWSEVI